MSQVHTYILVLDFSWIFLLKVVDKDPTKKAGEFEDLSAVEKYEMSTEDYSKRSGKLNKHSF